VFSKSIQTDINLLQRAKNVFQKLDNTPRQHTSANMANATNSDPVFEIRIAPKCSRFIPLSASVISPSFVKSSH